MELQKKIEAIQESLSHQAADGWLLFDNHSSNRFVRQVLEISSNQVLTRRFFYWIPKRGEPQKILHKIESESLNHLPGKEQLYQSWQELHHSLERALRGTHKVLMEYSPQCANPFISVVDAGTLEMIKSLGVEVASSADLLQIFTSVLDEEQIASHLEAAKVLENTLGHAWDLLAEALRQGKRITEYDIQKFILSEFTANDCITEEGPCCSVNEHSAMPHYSATKQSAKEILPGDFVLIDMWCKKNSEKSVYADITRVAVASTHATPKQQTIFDIVKTAQQKAFDFIRSRFAEHAPVMGFEVDDVCRSYIRDCGYGEQFTHRTGHNIDTHVHGAGAHFDNLETSDHRKLLPGMCFSVEPGIYLIGEFGVRLESNLLIQKNGSVSITGGTESEILCLL